MKLKWLMLIGSIVLCGYANAQQNQDEERRHVDRRIYIWDVTKSMQGHNSATGSYDPKLDVWDKVVDWLKADINAISDSSTELIVLPFQEAILDRWVVKATNEGKTELLHKIDKSKSDFTTPTYTNISGPFSEAKEKYISDDRNNLVILLTDGHQSNRFGGQENWINLIASWGDYRKKNNNAYLIYFMVTEAAKDDVIIEKLDNKEDSDVVTPSDVIPTFINISPQVKLRFNIKDNQSEGLYIPINTSKKGVELVPGIKISVSAETEAPIKIDEIAEIVNGKLHITPKYNFDELKEYFGDKETMDIILKYELVNQDEIKKNAHQIIFLTHSSSNLEMVNKIEKTLKIRLK